MSDPIAPMLLRLAFFWLLVCASVCDSVSAQSIEQTEFFESRIRPVLVEHCYECHNSADSADGDLAVDHRQAILSGGDGGPIIVPGNAAASRLIAVLRHEVDGLEMPENGPKLESEVVADFEKWINDGAFDPRDQPPDADEIAAVTSWESIRERRKQWWSFQPIQQADVPPATHLVDHFVDQKLAAGQIEAAPPAEAAVLVRRLFFTLIGLPPSAEQAIKWTNRIKGVNDTERKQAVGELVDELIGSPQFGERWARHWMDWIRYAESHGSEGDPRIDNAWMYRDYLIRAINNDVPYDQLVEEHIAGDLLENPRVNDELGINESMIGPAHWRMVFHGFAPTDALDERVRFTDDQINAFSKAFLGVTVSCARCHDHKFDAISQKDYYALFGVLASCRPGRSVIDLPGRQQTNRDELAKLKPQIREAIAADWLEQMDTVPKRIEGLFAKSNSKKPIAVSLKTVQKRGSNGWQKLIDEYHSRTKTAPQLDWDLSNQSDYQSWFHSGLGLADRPSTAGEFAIAPDGQTAIHGIYPAGVYSHTLSAKHPARLSSSDFEIAPKSEIWVQVIGDRQARLRYCVQNYPRNGTVYPVTALSNDWRWQRYDVSYWNGENTHLELAAGKDIPLLVKNENRSWFGIRRAIVQPIGHGSPQIKHESIAALLNAGTPDNVSDLKQLIETVLRQSINNWKSGTCSDDQALFLDACLREGLLSNNLEDLPSSKAFIEHYRRLESAIPVPTRVPGLDESTAIDWPLYLRGNHKTPGNTVPRRFLEAIDPKPFDTTQSGRRELAESVLAGDNPLTRRVIVNRIWHHVFGRGIVSTPDNFGRLGTKPSHPQLLDELAIRFSHDGWSIKKFVRLLVTSETWQRSANHVDQGDPDNALLARANVRRLEAEAIRDSLLSVAGQLDERLYGPPVDVNAPRRSVYMRVFRNSLDPFLRAFDFPEPLSTVGRRDATNVPAQSLTMLNDPLVQRLARAFAAHVLDDSSASTVEERTDAMFLATLGRLPASGEVVKVRAFIDSAKNRIEKHTKEVNKINALLTSQRNELNGVLGPVRDRLTKSADRKETQSTNGPKPISHWDFSKGAQDQLGGLTSTLKRGARIENGALIVDGSGYLVTSKLKQGIRAKTLEAWVQLDHYNQRGGGVMTIQTPNGAKFDSIVFAERDRNQWMSGSNNFARTKGFNAPQESQAVDQLVHVAIVYQDDGQVVGYRNGQAYGNSYQSNGPFNFKADDSVITFGVRHLPATGGRMLKGKIWRANLYDQALTPAEIESSAGASATFVTDEMIIAKLDQQSRDRAHDLKRSIADLESKLASAGEPQNSSELEIWTELARAMFIFKEFIYLR